MVSSSIRLFCDYLPAFRAILTKFEESIINRIVNSEPDEPEFFNLSTVYLVDRIEFIEEIYRRLIEHIKSNLNSDYGKEQFSLICETANDATIEEYMSQIKDFIYSPAITVLYEFYDQQAENLFNKIRSEMGDMDDAYLADNVKILRTLQFIINKIEELKTLDDIDQNALNDILTHTSNDLLY